MNTDRNYNLTVRNNPRGGIFTRDRHYVGYILMLFIICAFSTSFLMRATDSEPVHLSLSGSTSLLLLLTIILFLV